MLSLTSCRLHGFDLDTIAIESGWLSVAERERCARKVRPEQARRQAAAYSEVRRVLGAALGVEPVAVNIAVGEGGKPFLPDYPDWHFNLSHSRQQAMLAIARVPVGVDIEALIERTRPALAREVLTDGEFAQWQLCPDDQQQALLTERWVAKEAVLKAHGAGLRIGPARFGIEPSGTDQFIAQLPDGSAWTGQWVTAPEGFRAAVAVSA